MARKRHASWWKPEFCRSVLFEIGNRSLCDAGRVKANRVCNAYSITFAPNEHFRWIESSRPVEFGIGLENQALCTCSVCHLTPCNGRVHYNEFVCVCNLFINRISSLLAWHLAVVQLLGPYSIRHFQYRTIFYRLWYRYCAAFCISISRARLFAMICPVALLHFRSVVSVCFNLAEIPLTR